MDKTSACAAAKDDAGRQAQSNAQADGRKVKSLRTNISKCTCSKSGSDWWWTCEAGWSIDVVYED